MSNAKEKWYDADGKPLQGMPINLQQGGEFVLNEGLRKDEGQSFKDFLQETVEDPSKEVLERLAESGDQKSLDALEDLKAAEAANNFLSKYPQYVPCNENLERIDRWLKQRALPMDEESLDAAYEYLSGKDALILNPEEGRELTEQDEIRLSRLSKNNIVDGMTSILARILPPAAAAQLAALESKAKLLGVNSVRVQMEELLARPHLQDYVRFATLQSFFWHHELLFSEHPGLQKYIEDRAGQLGTFDLKILADITNQYLSRSLPEQKTEDVIAEINTLSDEDIVKTFQATAKHVRLSR